MPDTGDTGDAPDADTSRTGGTEKAVALSTAEAARVAGVSARTIRRWIEKGTLPAVTGAGGVLYVFPQDLEAARIASGSRPSPVARDREDSGDMSPSGTVRDDWDTLEDAGHVRDMLPVVSPAARSQLEAIRDEWLAPLVAQIREQAEQVGVLRTERDRALQERDALSAEVERLKAAQDAAVAAPEPQHEAQPAEAVPDASAPWWASWWHRLLGLDR